MPCNNCDYDISDNISSTAKKEIDSLTQKLCFIMGFITDHFNEDQIKNDIFASYPDLKNWWNKHLESDRIRLVHQMHDYIKDQYIKNDVVYKYNVSDHFIKEAQKVHCVSDWHKEVFFPECCDLAFIAYEDDNILGIIEKKLTKEEYSKLRNYIKKGVRQ